MSYTRSITPPPFTYTDVLLRDAVLLPSQPTRVRTPHKTLSMNVRAVTPPPKPPQPRNPIRYNVRAVSPVSRHTSIHVNTVENNGVAVGTGFVGARSGDGNDNGNCNSITIANNSPKMNTIIQYYNDYFAKRAATPQPLTHYPDTVSIADILKLGDDTSTLPPLTPAVPTHDMSALELGEYAKWTAEKVAEMPAGGLLSGIVSEVHGFFMRNAPWLLGGH